MTHNLGGGSLNARRGDVLVIAQRTHLVPSCLNGEYGAHSAAVTVLALTSHQLTPQ